MYSIAIHIADWKKNMLCSSSSHIGFNRQRQATTVYCAIVRPGLRRLIGSQRLVTSAISNQRPLTLNQREERRGTRRRSKSPCEWRKAPQIVVEFRFSLSTVGRKLGLWANQPKRWEQRF